MMRRFALVARPALRLWLAGLLALVLAGTSMAHRAAPEAPDPALGAFLAAGGTLADLCRDHDAPGHANQPPCEACRLFSAALPPGIQAGATIILTARTAHVAWPATPPVLAWPVRTHHSARAPPAMAT